MKIIRSVAPLALLVAAAAAQLSAQTADSAFAVSSGGAGLLRLNVDGGFSLQGSYDGSTNPGAAPVEGAGARLMWYPQKAAFRVGAVNGTFWNDANIGFWSVAAGLDSRAQGNNSIAMGLRAWAFAQSSVALGEDVSATGAASIALGYHAHTNARQGAFVFADRSVANAGEDTLRAGVNNSANWRVAGGFRIFTSSNLSTGVTIQSGASVSNWGQSSAVISTSTGALLTTGGVWQNASDVNRKHNFESVDGEYVLARLRTVPIRMWTYNSEAEEVRHLGPTSQDFMKAFGLGTDDKSIGTVDADGVALLGVQTLDKRTEELQQQVQTLLERVKKLEAALAEKENR